MDSSLQNPHPTRRHLWPIVAVVSVLLAVLLWSLGSDPRDDSPQAVETSTSAVPPWRYGRLDARFTLVEYADLECPYCKAYFPVLKRWIDAHPDVNWQWHHLPLPMHEPAATRGARLAECAGEVGGRIAFWNAIAWIHSHTLGGGQGLPPEAQLPGATSALYECLASTRPDVVIRTQAEEAAQAGVAATPTLRVIDNRTGRSLLLSGAVEGDALLSAVDLLVSSNDESSAGATSEIPEMSADPVGDMPR
jgi:protein-disulfide isomerase